MPVIEHTIHDYLRRLTSLRQNAAPAQRDAYTVAIGQLKALDLITEDEWRQALDAPPNAR